MAAEYSFCGAAVFCLYLVYDTWRLANELNVDDYVEGAIQFLSQHMEHWMKRGNNSGDFL